jgi:hypothetical protein
MLLQHGEKRASIKVCVRVFGVLRRIPVVMKIIVTVTTRRRSFQGVAFSEPHRINAIRNVVTFLEDFTVLVNLRNRLTNEKDSNRKAWETLCQYEEKTLADETLYPICRHCCQQSHIDFGWRIQNIWNFSCPHT